MANRLSIENSPYLLQHSDNPVDWFPWGEEALETARRENKPIFLSIGYAACHWCHVMAHESFEDPDTATLMNNHFVNIKVDREERPDLDNIYMSAVVAMTGQGGWPMSVFLIPTGEPFFGGTYFPPVRRHNMPSFREVLLSVQRTWEKDRDKILQSGQQILDYLRKSTDEIGTDQSLQPDLVEKAAFSLAQAYDWTHGGWGRAPKFPQPMTIEFLLRRAANGDKLALDIATHALDAMSKGGMYDVVGGGFSRYSTDDIWKVPHFEKMLYDNALLSRAYLHAYLITGDPGYRRICEETLDFLVREMKDPLGGFYSSLDADSEGVEGKYYLWKEHEIRAALPNHDDAEIVIAAYQISNPGNFEGANVLQRMVDDKALAETFKIPLDNIREKFRGLHEQMRRYREQRVPPATDDKVLVFWNALAMAAFSEAARYLKRPDYLAVAERNATFILNHMRSQNKLLRSWRNGDARHSAYLEDYAGMILGLLELYQSNFNSQWFDHALDFANEMLAHFNDTSFGFFDTRDDHSELIIRPKDLQDNATPSGNALAATALLLLSAYEGNSEWYSKVEKMLSAIQQSAARYPTGFAQWLSAYDLLVSGIQEIAILGDISDPLTQDLLEITRENYRPNRIVAYSIYPIADSKPTLLKNRVLLDNQPTVFVCKNLVCHLPVNTTEGLRVLLNAK